MTRLSVATHLVLASLLALAACGDDRPAEPQALRTTAPAAGTASADRPHVVFGQRRMLIDRLEVTFEPQVSTASRPSPETMVSDDPATVEVVRDGRLVAHRNGSTTIRSRHGEGSGLLVEVRAPDAMDVVPATFVLEAGAQAVVEVVGVPVAVPRDAVAWTSIPPGLVHVRSGMVTAGGKVGRGLLTASYGGLEAQATVEIVPSRSSRLSVTPASARLRVGEVRAFQALTQTGGAGAEWGARQPAVLVSMGGGMFQAVAPGRTEACASTRGVQACAQVEVRP